jgi:glucose-6-phosphate 1-dehydrogenase
VRNEKAKVLRATEVDDVVRGQYGRGYIEGKEVPGYREEEGIDPESTTETFVAAKLRVDTWRWADTPFYVRTGKRLAKRETTIAVQFKRVPQSLFTHSDGLRPNVLAIHVQPDEGVSLGIGAKVPGQGMTVRTVNMDFLYGGAFRTGLPEAYERLILDAMRGDHTLFTTAEGIERLWEVSMPLLEAPPPVRLYPPGDWGPKSIHQLVAPHAWRLPFERAWRNPNPAGG